MIVKLFALFGAFVLGGFVGPTVFWFTLAALNFREIKDAIVSGATSDDLAQEYAERWSVPLKASGWVGALVGVALLTFSTMA